MIRLIDFKKNDASQELAGYAGITEPYEELISRVSLDILRQSVPDCEIEGIRYLRSAGRHPGMRTGGMSYKEGSSEIKLQDMTMPFNVEITVRSDNLRCRLHTTYKDECRKMDEEPENE